MKRTTGGLPYSVVSEIALLQRLRGSVGIIKLVSVFDAQSFIGGKFTDVIKLVYEYMDGDLRGYMSSRRLTKNHVKDFLFQLLNGVKSCHSLGVLHRDLKPENILISNKGEELKITDVGIGRMFPGFEDLCTDGMVTRYYRAPEILLGSQQYHWPIDIWSVGCIFAEMLKGGVLFKGKNNNDYNDKTESSMLQLDEIFRKKGMPSSRDWPDLNSMKNWEMYQVRKRGRDSTPGEDWASDLEPMAKELLFRMLEYDPAKRISASEELDHLYFKDFTPGHMKKS